MRKARKLSPEQLLEMDADILFLCSTWNEKKEAVVTRSRLVHVVIMRKIIIQYIYRKYKNATHRLIAEKMGMKDHTTIRFHLNTFQDLLDVKDDVFMTYYEPIKQLFDAGNKEIQSNVG